MSATSDKIALVTGASRGLGAALAEILSDSFHVVAVAKTVGGLEELDDRIQAKGGSATLVPMDITDDAACQSLCRSIFDKWGGVDIWAHTAIHAAPLAPAGSIAFKDWEKSLSVNVEPLGRLIPYMTPLLLPRNGKALFFDDPAAGTKFHGSYGATKAAQHALIESWASETVNSGITVHLATPKPMPTATRARFHPGENREQLVPCLEEADRMLGEILV